jgi:hypothetical protein
MPSAECDLLMPRVNAICQMPSPPDVHIPYVTYVLTHTVCDIRTYVGYFMPFVPKVG